MKTNQLWPVYVEAYHAISQHYVPLMNAKAAEYQLPEGGAWLLLPVFTFDPEVVSAEKLRVRVPYTATRRYQAGLDYLVDGGFLTPEVGEDLAYRLSLTGRQAILAILQAGYDCMQVMQPMSEDDLENLANLIYKLVHACMKAPEPPAKWSLMHSRKIDPGENAACMIRIDQYLSDLAAYRDDCHLAAWQVDAIDGHAWELLTFVWRGVASAFRPLCDLLTPRGFLPEETQTALADLVERGWIQWDGNNITLTADGKAERERAEEATDRYFYRPWSCLGEGELEQMQRRLFNLKHALAT